MRRACLCSYHKAINGNGERLSAGMTGPGWGVLVRDHSQVGVLSIIWIQTTSFLFQRTWPWVHPPEVVLLNPGHQSFLVQE